MRFEPEGVVRPVDRTALLEALEKATPPIRAIGSLHSWSPIMVTDGTVVELDRLDAVEILSSDPPVARIGGGARLRHVVGRLRESGYALPSIGAVLEQTLAGAISTGTHGSGRMPLSAYVRALEVATLDENGKPSITRIDSGRDLLAARCSLGALGVIVSIEIDLVPHYNVEESIVERSRLEDILSETAEWPLTQFILVPWSWRWVSFRRRVTTEESAGWKRALRNVWDVASVDVGGHVLARLAAKVQSAGSDIVVRKMLQKIVPASLLGSRPIRGPAEEVLTLNHHWFRHLETEVFVPEHQLRTAVRLIEYTVRVFGGDDVSPAADVAEILDRHAYTAELEGLAGSFTHHYPIFFRRIEPDSSLISMSHGDEVWYSISFFCYGESRDRFYEMDGLIGRLLADACEARFHWGKFIPVEPERVIASHSGLEEFASIADRHDPGLRFRSDVLRRYIGPESNEESTR